MKGPESRLASDRPGEWDSDEKPEKSRAGLAHSEKAKRCLARGKRQDLG